MISGDYVELRTPEDFAAALDLVEAWKDPSIPAKQRAVADEELARWRSGQPSLPFDAFVNAVRFCLSCEPRDANGDPRRMSLLEVGCGSGYYYEVMRERGLDKPYRYCGVDYSEEMIRLALTRYAPDCVEGMTGGVKLEFDVANALALPCADAGFDVVVSGCCLLHLPWGGWQRGISEAARASRRWVILHRTPVRHEGDTKWYRKLAYDVPCIEAHFGPHEMYAAWKAAGLLPRKVVALGDPNPDGHAVYTYVLEKQR